MEAPRNSHRGGWGKLIKDPPPHKDKKGYHIEKKVAKDSHMVKNAPL